MYPLYGKAQPIYAPYANDSPHFPWFTKLLKKEGGIY